MSVVWVTGAKGFIGKHLCTYLAQRGDTVLGLGHGALPSEMLSKFGLSYWVNGEIEGSNLFRLFEQAGTPEAIYHLAGGSAVGLSIQSPSEDFIRTVTSTANLLEWIRLHTPKTKIVISSSAAIYGNSTNPQVSEEGYYIPYSPYGFHKRCAELLCDSYMQTFGMKITVVRLFSIYGPGLYKQLLWDLCSRLRHNPLELEMNGSGEELRDWLYIQDAVKILSIVASNSIPIINAGTGQGISVKKIVSLVCNSWGISPQIVFSNEQRPGDPQSLVADITKLKEINFTPQYQLSAGIERYVNWFQSL
jgi:UDP-glucose 4-epimerase